MYNVQCQKSEWMGPKYPLLPWPFGIEITNFVVYVCIHQNTCIVCAPPSLSFVHMRACTHHHPSIAQITNTITQLQPPASEAKFQQLQNHIVIPHIIAQLAPSDDEQPPQQAGMFCMTGSRKPG